MHWFNTADEAAHEDVLRALARGGFDEVIKGIANEFGLVLRRPIVDLERVEFYKFQNPYHKASEPEEMRNLTWVSVLDYSCKLL